MLYLCGLLFTSIAIGHMTSPPHGFLAFGLGLIGAAIFDTLQENRHNRGSRK
jgi:hypothetical protein